MFSDENSGTMRAEKADTNHRGNLHKKVFPVSHPDQSDIAFFGAQI